MLRILLFGLIVFLVVRGLFRLVHSIAAPQDEAARGRARARDTIDPGKIKDATFRDIDE